MKCNDGVEILTTDDNLRKTKLVLGKYKSNRFFVGVIFVLLVCFVSLFVGLMSSSFAGLTPVESIVITSENLSFDDNEAGSWKITESARWISEGKARITLDIQTVADAAMAQNDKDVLLVVGTSATVNESEFVDIKNNLITLGDNLLQEGSTSRIALVSFNSSFTVVNDFTSDRSLFGAGVNSLVLDEGSSYYEALRGIDSVLQNYEVNSEKELVVLFFTTSPPNQDMPNELAQYTYLDSQYPYLNINAIQYGIGSDVLGTIEDISDKQYTVDARTLSAALFDIVDMRESYDEFKIVNYIDQDYFKIENLDSVSKVYGEAKLEYDEETPKLVFDLSDVFSSGNDTTITFDILLNQDNFAGGIFATHKKTNVISLINDAREDVVTEDTPVIANNYKVRYDANVPSGCDLVGEVPEESHYSVFDTVKVPGELTCDGYRFKGWEVVSSKAVMVNTNSFLMPEEDVAIVGTWSKLAVSLSMDGTVFVPQTLNNIIKKQSVLDDEVSEFVTGEDGIDFSKISSDNNGKGVYELSSTKNDDFPIYYYRGAVDNNNIKFGGYCWKIVRTTSTGGVKLIYNGLPSSDGSCNNTGDSSQIQNSSFNSGSGSISDVGYLFGDRYDSASRAFNETWYGINGLTSNSRSMTSWYTFAGKSSYQETGVGTNVFAKKRYYYSTSISYNSSTGAYSLVSPSTINVSSLSDKLKGYYSCFSTSSTATCTSVKYILSSSSSLGFNDGILNYVNLSGGQTYTSLYNAYTSNVIYGSSVVYDEESATYTLGDTITSKPSNWSSDRSTIKSSYPYTCLTTSSTCTTVSYVLSHTSSTKTYIELSAGATYDSLYENALQNKYVYGNDVVYNEEANSYTLVDTLESSWIQFSADKDEISSQRHYTCLTDGDTCSDVYYIYYINENTMYYVSLNNGKLLNDVTDSILDNENTSVIKGLVDSWYSSNFSMYTNYLEDTVWCNDRKYSSLYGFDENTEASLFKFSSYDRKENALPSLSCSNNVDSFTVQSSNGNGLLDNPVGLLTADEVVLAGADFSTSNPNYYLYTGSNWWTMTPYYYSSSAVLSYVYDGYLSTGTSTSSYGVRPSISLKNGLMVMAGDGTAANPYILANNKVPITIDNADVRATPNVAEAGESVKLSIKNKKGRNKIISFILNGEVITGDSFMMPDGEAVITDVVMEELEPEIVIIESPHNPYPNSLNNKVYGEHTFEGATSLTVELTYQTESTSYDWVYLYNSPTSSTPLGNTKYGGKTKTTETIKVNGNYIKIVFRTDGSVNSYYGFYAKITANYD